jgi:hypothetical protein
MSLFPEERWRTSPSITSTGECSEARKPSKLPRESSVSILLKIQSTHSVVDRILAGKTLAALGITTQHIRSLEAAAKQHHRDRPDIRETMSSTSSRTLRIIIMSSMDREGSIMVNSLNTTRLQLTTTWVVGKCQILNSHHVSRPLKTSSA